MEQFMFIKSRNTGMWRFHADQMAETLIAGEKAAIVSHKEDQSAIDRYINYFKKEFNITVSYTRMTRWEPTSNWRPVYDRYSEIIGIEPVEQKELFIGWMLNKVPKVQECDATADAQRTEP